jgi:hypothetical protein
MSALHQARCFNHARREAVARCPGCRRFYCRECVTEHDDRLMCAACITTAAPQVAKPRCTWRLVAALAQAALGFVIIWLGFFLIGQTLLEAPSQFHEGTVWQENWLDSP